MRASAAFVVALILIPGWVAGSSAGGPDRAPGTCGRLDYPSAAAYEPESVVNAPLWSAFRAAGGFGNGTQGVGAIGVRAEVSGTAYVVRLEEILLRRYVGGATADTTILALRVQEEGPGGEIRGTHNFTLVDAGRPGGNLTLVAHATDGGLDVFWRWAFLLCDEAFPNLYHVFHAGVQGGELSDDNTLVYFESSRPSRGPPTDLILLITAGIAASAIFLLARRALRTGSRRGPDSGERTIK